MAAKTRWLDGTLVLTLSAFAAGCNGGTTTDDPDVAAGATVTVCAGGAACNGAGNCQ